MKVVVNRLALEEAIERIVNEDRSVRSARIDTIAGKEEEISMIGDEPIQPTPLMSTQLAVEMPPVEDPEFVPASSQELARAAAAISEAVPEDQVDFFYRKLHDLLDLAMDNHDEIQGGIQQGVFDTGQEISESLIKKILLEIESESDENPFESEESEEAYADEYFSSLRGGVEGASERLFNDVFEFEQSTISDWIEAGTGSDTRRNLERQHPYVFDKSMTTIDKVISILSGPLQSSVESAAQEHNVRPETLKMLVAKHYTSRGWSQHGDDQGDPHYTPSQIQVNQALAKELDELLPEHSYEDIIKIYEDKIEQEDVSEEIALGYRDMIEIVKGRIRDNKKRERTDFSVKNRPRTYIDADDGDDVEISDEERLKALDALAPFFGFKNASGIRQWRRKYAEPKFKAMLGSTVGKAAYEGYAERIMDNLAALLDEFATISESTLANIENELSKNQDQELEDLRDSISYLNDQFQMMLSESLDDEEGMIPSRLLGNTAAGYMLRTAFAEIYFNKQFRDFANEMKKHMISYIESLGASRAIATTFSKMFNGEVDLVPLNSDKKQAEKLRSGGISQDIYDKAAEESEKFTEEFFTGEHQKQSEEAFLRKLSDKKVMSKLFNSSIDSAIDEMELESNLDRATMSDEQISAVDEPSEEDK